MKRKLRSVQQFRCIADLTEESDNCGMQCESFRPASRYLCDVFRGLFRRLLARNHADKDPFDWMELGGVDKRIDADI